MDRTALQKVLYVDDEPDIRQIVQMALGLLPGVTTHTVDGGEQAIEMARELRPDLLLLDVMMPGLDGPGTFERLREDPQLKAIPVIFMTAKAMPKEVARFRAMGAAGVIAKPFDPMQLGKQVLALWESVPAEVPAHG
jgi:CheY-like chemotaxis protein